MLDEYRIDPNPAKGKGVRLPHEERAEINPPTAEQVEAVHDLLSSRYRLALVVLDATGMRIGELEGLTWGDVDEPRGRWRVSRTVSKTNRARWVNVPPVVFEAVLVLCPRDDRTAERPLYQGFGADRFRTAITRACVGAGVPTFSPHDLRHRRISLLHLGGTPLGADRQGGRPAQSERHRRHVQPRPARRDGTRLRGADWCLTSRVSPGVARDRHVWHLWHL